ncbi:hypothetical protein AAC387_Pa08g1765 [Persea americana]
MSFRFQNLLGAPYRGRNILVTENSLFLSPVGNRISATDLTKSQTQTLPCEASSNIRASPSPPTLFSSSPSTTPPAPSSSSEALGDAIIDGDHEWYKNTERRTRFAANCGILYHSMGVSGGEESARHGTSLMPSGSFDAYYNVEDILRKVAAQVNDGPCITYIGLGGSSNFVKMGLLLESFDLFFSLYRSDVAVFFFFCFG